MNNNPKTKFIKEMMNLSKEEIEQIIASKGKPPKLIRPAFVGRK